MQAKIGNFSTERSKATHQGFVMSDSINVYSIDYLRKNFSAEQKLFVDVFDKKDLSLKNSIDISPTPENDNPIELTEIFSINQKMVLVMVETLKSTEKRIVLQIINPNGTREKIMVVDTLPSLQMLRKILRLLSIKKKRVLSFVPIIPFLPMRIKN